MNITYKLTNLQQEHVSKNMLLEYYFQTCFWFIASSTFPFLCKLVQCLSESIFWENPKSGFSCHHWTLFETLLILELCDGRLLVVLSGWMSYEVGTGCLFWRGCTVLLQGTGRLCLEEVAALDLVAVLAGGELLVVGLVLGGNESFGHPTCGKNMC